MSATAVDTRTPSASPATRLHGLYWLVWHQNRILVRAMSALVVIGGGVLLWAYLVISASGCHHRDLLTPPCGGFLVTSPPVIGVVKAYLTPFMFGLPVLVGMFAGAPLLSQEYERGTTRLVWVQSVSRSRWLAVRLAVPALIVLLGVTALAGLLSWFWNAQVLHGAYMFTDPLFVTTTYTALGPVPVCTALFALVLGAVTGMLLRRTLVAVGLTGILVGAVLVGLRMVRSHLFPLVHHVGTNYGAFPDFGVPNTAWLLSYGTVLPDGREVPFFACQQSPSCLASHTYYSYYHPNSHFVPIQLIESGLLLALTAALVAFAFHRVRRSAA